MNDLLLSPAYVLARLESPDIEGLYIVTGPRAAGKSMLCATLIKTAQAQRLTVGGILCPAIFTDGHKTGIGIRDIATGEQRQLGSHAPAPGFDLPVGCWHFDPHALAWGNAVLQQATGYDVIVIDELGPLELEEGTGFSAGLDLLDNGHFTAAYVVIRPELLTLARDRWPQAAVINLARSSV